MGNKGFTLIELVMIIIILGILAAVAIPRYVDLQTSAEDASIRGLYGHISSAYGISVADKKRNPTEAEMEANITGDAGSLHVNATDVKNPANLNVDAGNNALLNYIRGERRSGSFYISASSGYITGIGSLNLTNWP